MKKINLNINIKADEFKKKLNIKDGKDGAIGIQGETGLAGKDGKDGLNGIDGKNGIDGFNGSPDTATEIKVKLESLTGDDRLDASAIKNLPRSRGGKIMVGAGGGSSSGGGTWGSITGTLSNQTDLQTALDAKASVLSGTTNELAYFNAPTTISSLTTVTYPSLTELSYVKGVTSAIQTQINAKGTVTSVSVVSANGFAGTVATATTTPAITLTTTLNTPVIAGNGTALIAATTTGTGSVVLNNSPTFVSAATFGTLAVATGKINFIGVTAGNITLIVPNSITTYTMTLPSTASGLANSALVDSDGAGTLGWATFGSGTVTDITAGTGLSATPANPITISGTITNNLSTGILGGQTMYGGTGSGENLIVSSTFNTTKGSIILGTSYYDEVNDRFGLGVAIPLAALHIKAGTATVAPIRLTTGTLTTGADIVLGQIEFLDSDAGAEDYYVTVNRIGIAERHALAFKDGNITGASGSVAVANEATDTTCFLNFTTAASGNLPIKTNANLTFNSSTGVATFGQTIAGSITGNAGTITWANEATDTSCFIGFATAVSGSLAPKTNANMTFDSSTGIATFASTVLTTTDINGGTIDGAVIGGSSAAAITGTTVVATTLNGHTFTAGSSTFTGTATKTYTFPLLDATLLPNNATSGVAATPTASQTDTITHGLGRIPTIIRIYGIGSFVNNAAATPSPHSVGTYTSSGNRCVYLTTAGTSAQVPLTSTVFAVFCATSSGNTISGVIQNVTISSFDIVWTETGTSVAQAFLWECQ